MIDIPIWVLVILCVIAGGAVIGVIYLASILLHMFDGW